MKRLVLAFLIIPFLVVTGCNRDDLQSPSGDGGLSFYPDTKAVTEFSGWADDDAIGIFMIKVGDQIDGGNTIKNRKYAYKTTKFLPASDTERIILPKDGTQVDFVSYFPRQATLTSGHQVAVDVSDQTVVEKSIDLLYSDNAKGHSEALKTVNFVYKHALSKVMIVFESAEFTADQIRTGITTLELKNVPTTAKFDMKTKTFIDKDAALGVVAPKKIAATDPAEYEAIMVPDKDRTGRAIHFVFNATPYTIDIDKADDFQSGKVHKYTLRIGGDEVIIEDIETIPWGDGGTNPIDDAITDSFIDPVFRRWVQDTFCDGRTVIKASDLVNVKKVTFTKAALIAPKTIAILAGIEYFTNLEELILPLDLGLSSLAVNANKKLKRLIYQNSAYFNGPRIKALNLSGCPELTYLMSSNALLTELDLSNNTKLDSLFVFESSELTHLDISTCVKLSYLNIYYTSKISSLDLSNCPELKTLICTYNQLTSLNVSSNPALTYLDCSSNRLTSLDVSSNRFLTTLDCRSNQLTSLNVSANTALTTLSCRSNQLTSLNVSANTALTTLNCYNNLLTSLNISGATALTTLNCYNNLLTSLNVSSATALTTLNCSSNQLTILNVPAHTALTDLDCSWNDLTSLILPPSNAELTILNCYNNLLSSLILPTGNMALTTLNCYDNLLTSLDVSNNKALTTLNCYNNLLADLIFPTDNIALATLNCYDNLLIDLDLSALFIVNSISIRFHDNPGSGTEAGNPNSPNPADFEVKLPRRTVPGSLPSAFPQSGPFFQWDYQFKNATGETIMAFNVMTKYVVAP